MSRERTDVMMHALGYEPRGQRQRFEPREQHEQDRHIHLHFHLDLTFRSKQERSIHPDALPFIRRIFAALLAATAMPLLILPLAMIPPDGPPPTTLENQMLLACGVSVVVGLALAWYAVGTLLFQAWRANPRGHLDLILPLAWRANPHRLFGLVLSLLLLLLILFGVASYFFGLPGAISGFLVLIFWFPYILMFVANPLITALLLKWVSREAGTLREQAPMHSKLGFVVVGGMMLMMVGGILFNLQSMLGGGISPLIYLLPICIAIIVAIRTLFGLFRSSGNIQAHPKDASLSDFDLSQEPREYCD
jgi:hypothetical protein